MSSFKEIVFVVQQSQAKSLGFERVAMELSKELDKQYTCTLKVIPASNHDSSNFITNNIFHFFYSLKHLFLCIRYARQGDIVYFFGKKPALSFPFISLLSKTKVFSQIQYFPKRLSGMREITRMWERLEERLTLNFASRVFVDSPKAQSYFKEEYNRNASLTFYGADHVNNRDIEKRETVVLNTRKYAIAYMPQSPQQALMALKSFAQYPKYDYYLMLETPISALSEEIQKFGAYNHIHLLEKEHNSAELFSNAYIYLHLEPSVRARIRLLEAMKAGKYTLCFDTVFSRNLTRGEALYFSNHSQLLSCFNRAVTMSHFNQGNRMKVLANSLSWTAVAENVKQHIEEIQNEEVLSRSLEGRKIKAQYLESP